MIKIQDVDSLLVDMMGLIAMEGFHAGAVREMLIVQALTQTRYGMPVYQNTEVGRGARADGSRQCSGRRHARCRLVGSA